MTGRIQAFRNNRDLQRFVLSDVRIKGRKLGVGSYGSVEELEVNGLVCAGKRLHEALVEQDNVGVDTIVRKYLQECQVTVMYAYFCAYHCCAPPPGGVGQGGTSNYQTPQTALLRQL